SGCRLFFAETDSLDAYLAGAYTSPGAVTPNDTFYVDGYHWHYDMVDLPRAWGILQDLGSAPGGAFHETYVAVVDSGIVASGGSVDHADLGLNVFYDHDDPTGGYDFYRVDFREFGDNDPEDPGDGGWHGTHVTGTIAADWGDGGVVGVGLDRLKVVPIRSLTDVGSILDVADGILYAVNSPRTPSEASSGPGTPTPVRVINLSLGGPGGGAYFYEAIQEAVDAGVTVVAAAGNNNGGKVDYPGAYDNTIAVSAVGPGKNFASYSSRGPEVDFAGPGGDLDVDIGLGPGSGGVLSTVGPEDDYAYFEGTSMATPHVAGIVGLLYAYEPNLSQSEVYTILLNTAEDLGEPGRDDSYGWGLVQAGKALEYLINAGREHGVAPSGGALSPQTEGAGSVGIAGVIPGTRPRGVVPQRRGALRPTPGAERHPTQILLRLEDAARGGRAGDRGRPSLTETARQAEALGNLHPGARIPETPVRGPGVIVLEAADPAGWLTLLEELAADPAVRYAQPVYRYRLIQ
ncbi:MAG: S8 family serine peptidase, partial [Spirochaetota bacterium]